MIILGVWDGTPSSAAIIVDGVLISSIAEERLSRKKNEYGYPARAINSVLNSAGITIIHRDILHDVMLNSAYIVKFPPTSGYVVRRR